MKKLLIALPLMLILSGCDQGGQDGQGDEFRGLEVGGLLGGVIVMVCIKRRLPRRLFV